MGRSLRDIEREVDRLERLVHGYLGLIEGVSPGDPRLVESAEAKAREAFDEIDELRAIMEAIREFESSQEE